MPTHKGHAFYQQLDISCIPRSSINTLSLNSALDKPTGKSRSSGQAVAVATRILLSRVVGLIRLTSRVEGMSAHQTRPNDNMASDAVRLLTADEKTISNLEAAGRIRWLMTQADHRVTMAWMPRRKVEA